MKPTLAIAPDPKYPLVLPKYGSIKLDGIRGLTQGASGLETRSLKPVPNEELRRMLAPYNGLDGELIFGAPNADDVYSRTYSAVMKKTAPVEDITFYAFDVLDSTLVYEDRLDKLNSLKLPSFIKVLPQHVLRTEQACENFYKENLDKGYEGAILRDPRAYYVEGRYTAKSQGMLKVKPYHDEEFIVEGIFEAMHNGNEEFINELGEITRSTHQAGLVGMGMIGGFTTTYSNGKRFNVAAGKLTHRERTEIFNNPQEYIGKLGTYRCLPIGQKDVPRHGRFIKWRSPLDL